MLCSCDDCSDSNNLFNSLQQLGKDLRFSKQINDSSNLFSVLGNIERLIILNVLKSKDRCVCELEAILDKSQPSISHHLRELEKVDLVRGWKKGKYTYYSLVIGKLNEYLKLILDQLQDKQTILFQKN